jgi:hypothetical protein
MHRFINKKEAIFDYIIYFIPFFILPFESVPMLKDFRHKKQVIGIS